MQKLLKFTSILFLTFLPFFASAATQDATGVLAKASAFFGALLPVLVALGVIYFVWGVLQYVIADSEEAKTKGKDRIIFGLIGLAVIVSVWGLVNILKATLGVESAGAPTNQINNLAPGSGSGCTALSTSPKFQDLMNYLTCIIGQSIIPLLFALAVVMFIWGAIKFFIIDADEEAKRTQGKQFMIWGIVALAVMVSIWGLVNILTETFNIDNVIPSVGPRQSS